MVLITLPLGVAFYKMLHYVFDGSSHPLVGNQVIPAETTKIGEGIDPHWSDLFGCGDYQIEFSELDFRLSHRPSSFFRFD